MAKKIHTTKPGAQLRVWIEWEYPSLKDYKDELSQQTRGDEIAARVTSMIARLSEGDGKTDVFWHPTKKVFCVGDASGFVEAVDNGHWFSLDYFGRD